MNISVRYRSLVEDVRCLRQGAQDEKEERLIDRALTELATLEEGVGEVPQMRLEAELTPVLLKAHSLLDRSRLLREEDGQQDRVAVIWEMEQQIYRLLNSL